YVCLMLSSVCCGMSRVRRSSTGHTYLSPSVSLSLLVSLLLLSLLCCPSLPFVQWCPRFWGQEDLAIFNSSLSAFSSPLSLCVVCGLCLCGVSVCVCVCVCVCECVYMCSSVR